MKRQFEELCAVISQKEIAHEIYELVVATNDIANVAVAGQFVNLYSKEKNLLLPRPISICETNGKMLRLVYRKIGKGTAEFSTLKTGDTIKIIGPLGNGFPITKKRVLLVGGGLGIPPMLGLAKRMGSNAVTVLGYRNELFLISDFEDATDTYISTEDGSAGTKGTVLDVIRENCL